MRYTVKLKPKAEKDLKSMAAHDRKRVVMRLRQLEDGLSGDVKRLTNFVPEFRLRVGAWRILFEVAQDQIVVYRIVRRDQAYR